MSELRVSEYTVTRTTAKFLFYVKDGPVYTSTTWSTGRNDGWYIQENLNPGQTGHGWMGFTGKYLDSNGVEQTDNLSTSFSFYTQPAKFSWKGKNKDGSLKGGSDGDIVNNTEFMNKWNNLCEVTKQYQRWRKQTDKNISYNDCMYEKDQWMSASKFNKIAIALEAKTDDNENLEVKKDDIITAKFFNDLIKNVAKE